MPADCNITTTSGFADKGSIINDQPVSHQDPSSSAPERVDYSLVLLRQVTIMRADSSKVRQIRLIVPVLALGAALLAACDQNTPLMQEVLNDDSNRVQELVAQGDDLNSVNNYGWTALMHAARLGNSDIVSLLLEQGAKVDVQDKDGWTALMRAAAKGHDAVVKILLDHHAALNLQDKDGYTALHWAAHRGHIVVVKQLLDAGADTGIKNRYGWTPLMVAMQERRQDVVTLLERYSSYRN